jgi:hypothetical protein
MILFGLYDAEEFQLLATYGSEAEALSALLASHETSGDWSGVERLVLSRTVDDESTVVAEGQDLAKYVLEHGQVGAT